MTYTYVLLPVSQATYDEVAKLLREAGYHHAFHKDIGTRQNEGTVIDMNGIALAVMNGAKQDG